MSSGEQEFFPPFSTALVAVMDGGTGTQHYCRMALPDGYTRRDLDAAVKRATEEVARRLEVAE